MYFLHTKNAKNMQKYAKMQKKKICKNAKMHNNYYYAKMHIKICKNMYVNFVFV